MDYSFKFSSALELDSAPQLFPEFKYPDYGNFTLTLIFLDPNFPLIFLTLISQFYH